ncbi:MAG: RlmE family RNA methyltransferase [Candidatus Methanomethylophilaceae archaeon]|nr:RlmE family RNA methyltransferase [Candidatus Methanomethylophilaceae archaeon]
MMERRNEHYYKLAKKLNYRSRASFKLIQIDNRFNIFSAGDSVVDLGACPGGWLQVAKERTWPDGRVIGVDLRYIRPLEGVETFVGDITEDSTMKELLRRFGGKADVVLSDMAPNIAGHYSTDHARSINLCMYAIDVCDRILKKEGKLVMKVFMGDMFPSLQQELEKRFQSVKVHSPDASRPTSSEVYVICKGFNASTRVRIKEVKTEEKKPEFTAKGGVFRWPPGLMGRSYASGGTTGPT